MCPDEYRGLVVQGAAAAARANVATWMIKVDRLLPGGLVSIEVTHGDDLDVVLARLLLEAVHNAPAHRRLTRPRPARDA